MSGKCSEAFPVLGVPQLERTVPGGRKDLPPIGAPFAGSNTIRVSHNGSDAIASPGVPQLERTVLGGRKDYATIAAPCTRRNHASMSRQC
jgi:hypothetical protein